MFMPPNECESKIHTSHNFGSLVHQLVANFVVLSGLSELFCWKQMTSENNADQSGDSEPKQENCGT